LQELKALSERLGFELSHQARFANPCFPAQQSNLSPSALRLLNEQVEDGKVGASSDQNRANNWSIQRYRH
jgi:hypothetical protein